MKRILQLAIAALITIGLPALAQDSAPKPKAGAKKSPAKSKPKAKAKADAKADAKAEAAAPAGSLKEDVDRLNESQRRRAEADQKDRVRGSGASSGATSSTPSAPSGVDTTR
jgi:hypothetical protein